MFKCLLTLKILLKFVIELEKIKLTLGKNAFKNVPKN